MVGKSLGLRRGGVGTYLDHTLFGVGRNGNGWGVSPWERRRRGQMFFLSGRVCLLKGGERKCTAHRVGF
jgi:hypothetical protein